MRGYRDGNIAHLATLRSLIDEGDGHIPYQTRQYNQTVEYEQAGGDTRLVVLLSAHLRCLCEASQISDILVVEVNDISNIEN